MKKGIKRIDNTESEYKIYHLDSGLDKRCFDAGQEYAKVFHVFRNENGEDVLFKKTVHDLMALSDVFHSKVAIVLGQPAAVNELAIGDYSARGVISKIFSIDGDEIRQMSADYKMDDRTLYYPNVVTTLNKWGMQKKESYPMTDLPRLNLEQFIRDRLKNETPEFINEFIRVWLTSHVFGNMDTDRGHNLSYIKRNGLRLMAPTFDNEAAILFVRQSGNNMRNDPRIIEHDDMVFNRGLFPDNYAYLMKNHKQITEEYFDSLLALKNNPKFADLCDFSGLEEFLRMSSSKLAGLSEDIFKGTKKRIDATTNREH